MNEDSLSCTAFHCTLSIKKELYKLLRVGEYIMRVDDYKMKLVELPQVWKPIPFSYEHRATCRYCEMRKRLILKLRVKGVIR